MLDHYDALLQNYQMVFDVGTLDVGTLELIVDKDCSLYLK